jgi:drug/metabolite transporter (DMT)-like permease
MTIAVVLALASSVGWGISDFLGGLRSRAFGLLPVLVVSQVAALVLLAGFVGLVGAVPPDAPHLLAAAAAGVSEVVGVAALYRGLAVGRASVVAPVAAAAPVVPFAVGLALGQVPGPLQVGGLVLVVAGIVLAAHQRRSAGGGAGVAVLHGAVSAAGFGAFFVFMDAASEAGLPWALLVSRLTAVVAIVGVAFALRVRVAVPRRALPGLALIGVLIIGADAAYAAATTVGYLGVVAVLAAFHPVVTIGLAATLLRERIDAVQRAGVAAALLGVVAVTAA